MRIHIFNDQDVVGKRAITNQMQPVYAETIREVTKVLLRYHVCLADLTDGIRDNEHFKGIHFLQFDFDDGSVTPDEVRHKLDDFAHFCLASVSDSESHRKFHVFIPVIGGIDDVDVYRGTVRRIAEEFNLSIDSMACDAVRYFVKHKSIIYDHAGDVLNPANWKPMAVVKVAHREPQQRPSSGFQSEKHYRNWADSYCMTGGLDLKADGSRWINMCRLVRRIKTERFASVITYDYGIS